MGENERDASMNDVGTVKNTLRKKNSMSSRGASPSIAKRERERGRERNRGDREGEREIGRERERER